MKTATYKGSIQKKFVRAIFSLVSLMIISAYFLFSFWYLHQQKHNSEIMAHNLTQGLAQDFVRLALLDDLNTATDLTTKLQALPNINKIIFTDKEKKNIFQYNAQKQKNITQNLYIIKTTVYYKNDYYGKLYFEFKVDKFFTILQEHFLILLLVLLVFLTLSFFLAKAYAKHFSKPILYLVNFLEKVEFHENMKRYKIKGTYDDEIGKLYEEVNFLFNKMLDFLEEKKEVQKRLKFLMEYDPLTGLLNKNGLIKALKKYLNEKDELQWHLMFYIKITNLKTINHTYGYDYGDFLLKEISQNLNTAFKDATLYAHIGTGEFVLFYKNIANIKEEALHQAQNLGDALSVILTQPLQYKEKMLHPEIYIGIDIINHENDPLKILRETNIALEVGREKHHKVSYFNNLHETYQKETLNVFEELPKAIKENQLEMFYQLQYNVDGSIYGAEALIRWQHPIFGLLTPYKFIPIAERTDLIVDIGEWVIEAVAKQLQIWQKNETTKKWIIAINVSAKQFHKENFITHLEKIIHKYKINPHSIKLELLESLFVENQELVAQKMVELKALGFKLSLDDFGTGFSSLQYLKTFPLDQIKIDQSFVLNMFNNKKDIQIIKSIIYLGKLLNMNVIAEGVEEKEHYIKLKELGCLYFQGYHFAKPKSINEIEKLISNKM